MNVELEFGVTTGGVLKKTLLAIRDNRRANVGTDKPHNRITFGKTTSFECVRLRRAGDFVTLTANQIQSFIYQPNNNFG